jgi:hypothetical protein
MENISQIVSLKLLPAVCRPERFSDEEELIPGSSPPAEQNLNCSAQYTSTKTSLIQALISPANRRKNHPINTILFFLSSLRTVCG